MIAVVLAGCTSGGTSGISSSSPTSTATEDWVERAENTHDPKTVSIENALDRPVTVQVRIRMSGETVQNESYLLEPDASKQVYDTAIGDPDGSEAFAAVITVGNVTREEGIATNQCVGDPTYMIHEDESGEPSIDVHHSVC
ncbi:hypothetical protein [Haloarchaeobius sp. HRN-SO-5]|uniref:hypothetical protein n=1 Tax=Haloarchaeobius sp. HRN-SO-5 TaxID=3446118 RepID=UPI003EBF1808